MNPEQWLSLKWNGGSTLSDRWLNQSKIIHISLFRDILSPFLNIMSYLEDILFWTTIYPKTKISEISNWCKTISLSIFCHIADFAIAILFDVFLFLHTAKIFWSFGIHILNTALKLLICFFKKVQNLWNPHI